MFDHPFSGSLGNIGGLPIFESKMLPKWEIVALKGGLERGIYVGDYLLFRTRMMVAWEVREMFNTEARRLGFPELVRG